MLKEQASKQVLGRTHTKELMAIIAISTLIVLIGLLAACGDATTIVTTSTSTTAAAGPGGNAGADATDPYTGLNAEQVLDTYLKAYQNQDFETCRALLSKEVLAGWSSPDELKLQAEAQEKQFGRLQIKIFGLLYDQGSTVTYLVQYTRTGGSPTPTAQILIPASPIVPTATQPGAPTATPIVRSANFELRRENNTWKISNYTVI